MNTRRIYRPDEILVHEDALQDEPTASMLARLTGITTRVVKNLAAARHTPGTLILTRYPGNFLKPCQGGGAEMCCGYHVAGYTWNCHLDCTYCVLQGYLTDPAVLIATNIEDYLTEVATALAAQPERVLRIGTGELADSLAQDAITQYSRWLVPFFATRPNGFLELKTKTNLIDNLENLPHGGHTIISWSLNARSISQREEGLAATLEERLAAAAQCAGWGYRLGFHFDPLVYFPGWEMEYREVVRRLFAVIDPQKIAWISLGALRFTPHLRDTIRRRHPGSPLPYGEFIPGHYGKLRYFRPIREELYRRMLAWIRAAAPEVFVYLCMENLTLWERLFPDAPREREQLTRLLDQRALTGTELREDKSQYS